MPAIAPIEDLRAAQEEGLGIYAMLYALCSTLYEVGAGLGGKNLQVVVSGEHPEEIEG